jgi:hypothetical protein
MKGSDFVNQEINLVDHAGFKDETQYTEPKHYLKGVVEISRRNKTTGETQFVHRGNNIIPISGYQWILMKMFGLYLDAPHHVSYEQLDQDTNLVIPELNQTSSTRNGMGIGVDPNNYSLMGENISSDHICQGFMVGNGGAGEDQLTTKNTDYSFINLRNPIPFLQTQDHLTGEDAAMYTGRLRTGSSGYTYSYYIKKFSEVPHIYHSWWKDGQKWDYVDPVTPSDLGPDATDGAPKTNRIETYVECKLVLSEDDFQAYFANANNSQTPAINELGLVAFDTTLNGVRSIYLEMYRMYVKPLISILFKSGELTETDKGYLRILATNITSIISNQDQVYREQENIASLYTLCVAIQADQTFPVEKIQEYQATLGSEECLSVIAYYNQYGEYSHEVDQFKTIVTTDETFDTSEPDEAQRIKLVTYYTFKSIPIEENWETLINYRIYAN